MKICVNGRDRWDAGWLAYHADSLDDHEKVVMLCLFGGESRRTQRDVGRELGITGERVRQIWVKTLRKLRHPARLRRITELYKEHHDGKGS